MQQVAAQLNQFAKAAVCHASEQHALSIDNQHIEIARVLRPGGLYVGQHKQPASLQADIRAAGASPSVKTNLPLA